MPRTCLQSPPGTLRVAARTPLGARPCPHAETSQTRRGRGELVKVPTKIVQLTQSSSHLLGRCRRHSGGVSRLAGQSRQTQQYGTTGSEAAHSPASLQMLFGSPLSHLPSSLQDAVSLALSPNRAGVQSGSFSPSPFQTLFQSPTGATLDDSPYQALSHPIVKHSPVSAAAQHTAAQASRQAAVGQAQGQRGEPHHTSRAADILERTSTAMLIPLSAPSTMQVKVI